MKNTIQSKHQFLPNINKFLVFDAIRKKNPVSATEIVRLTNISKPTVMKILKELTFGHYIINDGKGESMGGRKPGLYKFNKDARYIIGVNFEIPKVRIISTDLGDHIITQKNYTFNIKDDVSNIIDKLKTSIGEVINESTRELRKNLIGIGIAISGFIDQKNGFSLSTPRMPQWKDVPLGKILQDEFKVPVRLINDTDARMMAEVEFGLKDMADNLIYVAFNIGLGAGLIVDGNLISGTYGNAGSISHTTVNPGGPLCICGNHGCLELYASERGILHRFQEQSGHEKDCTPSPGNISFMDIIKLYKDGDKRCARIFKDAAYYMGIGIANMVNLLEVDLVIISGSIIEAGNDFLSILQREVKSHLQGVLKTNLKFQFAKLKDDETGAIGATVPLVSDFFKEPELKLNSQIIEITNTQMLMNR